MKFSDIAGHKETIDALRGIIDSGRIPHAIMLSGISGIGKHRLARAFAQYLHCSCRSGGDSCGQCPSCLQHQRHNNPDLHFVYPIVKKKKEGKASVATDFSEEWKTMLDQWSYMPPERWSEIIAVGNSQPLIYVSESEDIIAKASLSAFQEKYKVFLVWLPEKLQPDAANKLLKIIEEPFEDTVFIFVSNDDSKVLPTIFSRTQRFNLRPLHQDEIESYLISVKGIDSATASTASKLAEGSAAKAEEFACHSEELGEFSDLFKEIMRMAYSLNAAAMKTQSEKCASWGREKLIRFLNYANRMVRENFIYNIRIPALSLMTPGEEEFSKKFSPFIHEGNVEGLSRELSRAAVDIERNANAKIVVFDLLLLVSQWVRLPKPASLPFS